MFKKLDHIGIAVDDFKKAVKAYKAFCGINDVKTEEIKEQKVEVAFFPVKDINLELLHATDKSSPIAKFINKKGSGLHHLCFEVDDLEKAKHDLSDKGFVFVELASDIGAHGTKIAFIHPKSTGGTLIELVEHPKD